MAQRLGNVAVGSVLKLKEGATPQNYIVVQQGLPSSKYDASCNGTWLLRQEIKITGAWDNNLNNQYPESTIATQLANDFFDYAMGFEADIKSVIKQVKIPYCVGDGYAGVVSGANGFSCRLFLLSGYEIGFTEGTMRGLPLDGSPLAYFEVNVTESANNKRIAYLQGRATGWWMRSPDVNSGNQSFCVDKVGYGDLYRTDNSYGIRPAMVMPADLVVDDDGNILAMTYPEPPASIAVPSEAVPTGSPVAISWASVADATYKLQRSADGGSWTDLWAGSGTSYSDTAGVWNKVKYRVASVKGGIVSGYLESQDVQVLPYTVTKLTVPSQVMEGQQIPISWSVTAAAETYVLERRASPADWTQVYSGAGTQFTDTAQVGWTSLQYRVKAGKDGTYGGYTIGPEIPVISASALVISGQDGDLGVLADDVPYTVSSDSGNPITLERYVNGSLVTKVVVESGFAYSVPVMELPTGMGTIKLVCSVTPTSGGPVTATRAWSYTKSAVQFPDEGGPAVLQQEGKVVLPVTLAECVKVPANWGGSLDKGLELLLPLLSTAMMAIGSYQGTGTFGPDSPNELSFTFEPELILISGPSGSMTISSREATGGERDGYIQDQTAVWYAASAAAQFNAQGIMYTYWAIGKAVQT